jgi:hypothetical protein
VIQRENKIKERVVGGKGKSPLWDIISLIHINLVHGRANTFFLFEENNIDCPITNFFGTLGHSPIAAPLWTSNPKIETNVFPSGPPFHFIYIGVELRANHMGQNCGAIGNNLGNPM